MDTIPRFAVELYAAGEVLPRDARLLCDASGSNEIADAVALNVGRLDPTFAHHAAQEEIGQTERDAQLTRKRPLRAAVTSLDFSEEPPGVKVVSFHVKALRAPQLQELTDGQAFRGMSFTP